MGLERCLFLAMRSAIFHRDASPAIGHPEPGQRYGEIFIVRI